MTNEEIHSPEIEKLRQRAVPGSEVAGLPQYPVDDIKKGQKYAVALPRWIAECYEGQMYTIETATEDMKGTHSGLVFRPYLRPAFLALAKEEKEITDKLGKSAEEMIAAFIVNQLGINLCAVKSINVDRQEDGQIKQIKIDFIPNNKV